MRTPLIVTALVALAAAPGLAQEGGIEIFAGETLFAEGMRLSVTQIWKTQAGLLGGSKDLDDPLDRTYTEARTVIGYDYGFKRHWTFTALMPWVERSLDSSGGDQRGAGPGDLALLVKHNVYKKDWRRGALHGAWIAGFELPTGVTDERDAGAKLAPSLQPGSGSVDPFLGFAWTLDQDRWRADAVALYKANTEGAQDFEAGDKLTLSLAGKYRFLHTKYPGPTAGGTLGLKWSHTGRAESKGVTVDDSGREELLLKLGLGWHPRPDVDISLGLDLPLYEEVHGEQLGLDSRISLALGFRF